MLLLACMRDLLPAQTIQARLDLGRRDPLPVFMEYTGYDGGLITLGNATRRSSRNLALRKYDENFELKWTKPVLTQNGRNQVDFITVLDENIYAFVSEYVPRERSIVTYYKRFNLEGDVETDREVISELPNMKEHKVDLQYTRSINKKVLLAYKVLDKNFERETILYNLFIGGSGSVQQGEISIPYPDEKFSIKTISVGNDGQIYVLGKYYVENRVRTPNDFGYKIYRYSPGEKEGESVDIDLGDLYITDLLLKIDPMGRMNVAGYYSERGTDAIIGVAFARVDDKMEMESSHTEKFPEEVLARFLSDRQIDKGKELKYFYLDDIILRSDGGMVLVGEKFYTSFNSYVDIHGYWVDQKVYHYDDILVSSIDGEGNMEWSAVAHKRQSSENRANLSYQHVVSGAALYLLYQYRPRRSMESVYVQSVSLEGDVSQRQIMLPDMAKGTSFFPGYSEQISNTEALLTIYQSGTKAYSILKVAFPAD